MMELTRLDRVVGYISPTALRNRLIARAQLQMLRSYDAANQHNSSSINRNSKSASNEVRGQVAPVRENVREVVRNTPFAERGLSIIVNGIVGSEIVASIKHPNPKTHAKLLELWREWTEGKCTTDKTIDFAMFQRAAARAIVSDGEVLTRDEITDGSVRLRLLESDFINDRYTFKDSEYTFSNGIISDSLNRPLYYTLFDRHPGDFGSSKLTSSSIVPESEVIHVFRQDRPEMNRGISWFAPVVHPLKMLNELQWTQLMRLKLSASITGIVTRQPSQMTVQKEKQSREDEFELSPGMFKFLNPGESINFPQIPNPEGFGGTTKLTLLEVAAGLGITYESLAGDWGGVNFSSGRLGDIGFKQNCEAWRWGMFVPRLLNPAFDRFKRYCAMRGVNSTGVTVEWVPPAWPMISPSEEVSAANSAIRSGLKTLPSVLREMGIDPDKHLAEMSESNKKLDELGLILDSDPRRTANGQLQSPDSLAALKGKVNQ